MTLTQRAFHSNFTDTSDKENGTIWPYADFNPRILLKVTKRRVVYTANTQSSLANINPTRWIGQTAHLSSTTREERKRQKHLFTILVAHTYEEPTARRETACKNKV